MKMVIVVRDENDDNLTFDFAGEPLTPTVGDLQLATNAPEMHELLHEVLDEFDEAFTQKVIADRGYLDKKNCPFRICISSKQIPVGGEHMSVWHSTMRAENVKFSFSSEKFKEA